MTDTAELGPLDVQLRKVDELGALTSGLIVGDALDSLIQRAKTNFEQSMLSLRVNSGLQISTKSAAEISIALTTGLFAPVLSKIDPLSMAENERNLRIAEAYAVRLNKGNLKENTVASLIYGYPCHSFVIDRREAEALFVKVYPPSAEEEDIIRFLSPLVYHFKNHGFLIKEDDSAEIFSINEKVEQYDTHQKQQQSGQSNTNTAQRAGTHAAGDGVNAQTDGKPATDASTSQLATATKSKQAARKVEPVND